MLGNELVQAAKRAGEEYLGVIEKIRDTGLTSVAGKGLPKIISATKLCASPPPTPPELIEGILHRGGKLALGGGSKSFKTWTLLEAGICVSTGLWNGWAFRPVPARSYTLTSSLLTSRLQSACRRFARQSKSTFRRIFTSGTFEAMRQTQRVILPKIARRAKREEYSLIILDPLYKLLGARDENASRGHGGPYERS